MYKCQFGVVKNRHILDSLLKFIFFFLKSDKAEIIINDNNNKSKKLKKFFSREFSSCKNSIFLFLANIYIYKLLESLLKKLI